MFHKLSHNLHCSATSGSPAFTHANRGDPPCGAPAGGARDRRAPPRLVAPPLCIARRLGKPRRGTWGSRPARGPAPLPVATRSGVPLSPESPRRGPGRSVSLSQSRRGTVSFRIGTRLGARPPPRGDRGAPAIAREDFPYFLLLTVTSHHRTGSRGGRPRKGRRVEKAGAAPAARPKPRARPNAFGGVTSAASSMRKQQLRI